MKFVSKKPISPGAVHNVSVDLRKVLVSDPVALVEWEDISYLRQETGNQKAAHRAELSRELAKLVLPSSLNSSWDL